MGAAQSTPASTTTVSSTSSLPTSTSLLPSTTTSAVITTTSSITATTTPAGPYVPVPYRDPNANPTPPMRKDIDTLSTEELSLFVLAMQQWEKSSATIVGGYFQVAGIHGAPHAYWDAANNNGVTSTGNKNTGYCFHGDQNFYLWHRPYVTLFEQQMIATAKNISNNWYAPQRSTYQAVAANLRLPYWDWAKSGTVPATLANAQITVVDSTTGQSTSIANPLYSHTLVSNGNLGSGISVASGGSRTTKRGSNYLANMQSAGASLKKNTALLFNTPNVCWNVFATYNTNEQQQCTGNTNVASLESIHNTVHNTISQTMANLDVAAFDPIFWLHHANVDRLGAIWQAIYPTVRVQDTSASDSTFVADPGVRGDSFSYLPFRASQGDLDWWRPNELYDIRATGYTYPELADQPSSSTALSRANAIYGNGRTQAAVSSAAAKLKFRRRRDLQVRNEHNHTVLNEPPTPEDLAPYKDILISANGSFNEYTVQADIQKSVAPGVSFDLHLFFGTPEGTNYMAANNRVGGFSVSQSGSANTDTTVTGIVPITDALLNKLCTGDIKDMQPETVQLYTQAQLVWRLVTSEEVDIAGNATSNGLSLVVKRTVVTPKSTEQVAAADSSSSQGTAQAAGPAAVPVVAADSEPIADTTNNTVAVPPPEGVAASSTSASASAATASATA